MTATLRAGRASGRSRRGCWGPWLRGGLRSGRRPSSKAGYRRRSESWRVSPDAMLVDTTDTLLADLRRSATATPWLTGGKRSPSTRRPKPGPTATEEPGECQIRVNALMPRKPQASYPRARNGLRAVPPSRARIRQTAEDGGLSVGKFLNAWKPSEASLRTDGIGAHRFAMQVGLAALLAGLPMKPGHAPFAHADAVDGVVTGFGRGPKAETFFTGAHPRPNQRQRGEWTAARRPPAQPPSQHVHAVSSRRTGSLLN